MFLFVKRKINLAENIETCHSHDETIARTQEWKKIRFTDEKKGSINGTSTRRDNTRTHTAKKR